LQQQKDAVNLSRQYRVPDFDLQALACFRTDQGPAWINQRVYRVHETFREVTEEEDKAVRRVTQQALRALHALGLDHGLVTLGMGERGVLYVLDVTPTPVLQGRLLDLYVRAVEDWIDREERLRQASSSGVRLGADVELMLRSPAGKMVLASRYLPRKGRVGCDDRSVQFDGQRLPLMELRPDPDPSPLGLLANLRSTMVEASRLINQPGVAWLAGSMPFRPYCTGGHIHFSNVPYSSHLVRVLDLYLGLPLMLVEDPRTARLRRKRYGYLGDVRMKAHGGFEYRTPASFVVSPDVTAAAFCLAAVVAEHHRELPLIDLYEENTQAAFYSGRADLLRPLVERAAAELRRLAAYERWRDSIEPLFDMIRAGITWDESVDVRTVWGIPLADPRRRRGRRSARA
ncbi:MAG: hypothetical protein K6T31_08575, partial [Alicyclobacillus sp.]|nr:hypothetical protein [Alicyclobacillus sp.]